jgi:hypothetical protein
MPEPIPLNIHGRAGTGEQVQREYVVQRVVYDVAGAEARVQRRVVHDVAGAGAQVRREYAQQRTIRRTGVWWIVIRPKRTGLAD